MRARWANTVLAFALLCIAVVPSSSDELLSQVFGLSHCMSRQAVKNGINHRGGLIQYDCYKLVHHSHPSIRVQPASSMSCFIKHSLSLMDQRSQTHLMLRIGRQ